MRTLVCFLSFILTSLLTYSQGFQDIVTEDIDELCSGYQSEEADPQAEMLVDQMMAQMQLKRAFEIRTCSNINNARATIEKDENGNLMPYILYDPIWLKSMSAKSQTDWASIGVLAHEVGHFLLYHALNNRGSNPRWELDADRFAGKTMAMMGSTLEEAQSMFSNYTRMEDSSSHPGKNKRLEAVKTGWMNVNNPTKHIILNENTPEKDVSPELIVNRYFEKLGGLKKLIQVKALKFEEEISETKASELNPSTAVFTYGYKLKPNKIIVDDEGAQRQYVITNNDSIAWRYSNEEKWREGTPRIGTSMSQNNFLVIKQISPSLVNFFDDFLLIANPEVVDYRRRKVIAGEECFVLEYREKTIDVGDLNKKGMRINRNTQYFFSSYTGLLHAIVQEDKMLMYKRGNLKDASKKERTQKVFSNYKLVNDLLFPHTIKTTETTLISDIPQPESIFHQTRELIDVKINPDL